VSCQKVTTVSGNHCIKKMKTIFKRFIFSLIFLLSSSIFCFCITEAEITNYLNSEIIQKILTDYKNYSNLSVSINIKNYLSIKKLPVKVKYCKINFNKTTLPIGLTVINLDLLDEKNKLIEQKSLIVFITAKADFIVTNRILNSKEIIKESDLEIINTELNNKPNNCIFKKSDLINKEVKFGIPKGSVITTFMVQNKPIIRKGDKITMIYLNNNIQLELKAIALDDGCMGANINVKSCDSTQTFKGEIIEINKVLVINN